MTAKVRGVFESANLYKKKPIKVLQRFSVLDWHQVSSIQNTPAGDDDSLFAVP